MNDFLAMGGYAQYVWSAYSISLIVLVLTVVLTKRALTQSKQKLARRLASQQENAA